MLAGQDLGFLDALFVSVTGIGVVMLELMLIAVFIIIISKIIRAFEHRRADVEEELPAPAPLMANATSGVPLPETQSAGDLILVHVEESTAAVIMAIVSEHSGIPLNRLRFQSIKLLEEKES